MATPESLHLISCVEIQDFLAIFDQESRNSEQKDSMGWKISEWWFKEGPNVQTSNSAFNKLLSNIGNKQINQNNI